MISPACSATLGFRTSVLPLLRDQLHLDVARAVQRHRLLAVVEVAAVHVRHMRARGLRPFGHRVRVLPRVLLHRARRAAVGVAFAQHRVDRRADALGVACLDRLLFVGLRVVRVVRDLVALALQLLDRRHQLRHRRADVGQLDDVGVRLERLLAQLGQRVGHALLRRQVLGEVAEDPRRDRDVARLDPHAGRLGERADDRQEGAGRQKRRLVGERVDDGRIGTHAVPPRCATQGLRDAKNRRPGQSCTIPAVQDA